jgi:hypothetical protein
MDNGRWRKRTSRVRCEWLMFTAADCGEPSPAEISEPIGAANSTNRIRLNFETKYPFKYCRTFGHASHVISDTTVILRGENGQWDEIANEK